VHTLTLCGFGVFLLFTCNFTAEKLQHNSNAGQAVRIFHSFLPNTPTSEKREEQRQNIHKIFERDDVADKAVAIISISGAFRQGKSFLSNLLLRHLQSWISSKVCEKRTSPRSALAGYSQTYNNHSPQLKFSSPR